MPSDPPPPSRPAPPSDAALVERSRQGDRGAFAVLFGRHAAAVAERAAGQGLAPAAAARVVRDVFRTAARSLRAPAASADFGAWLRTLTMDRLAAGAGRGPRLAPGTSAAAQRAGHPAHPAVRDAVWRELERGWARERQTLWERHGATIAASAGIAALLVAVLVVGVSVLEQIRPPAPAGAVRLTAQPLEVVEEEAPPAPAPSVIVPPVVTEEPFVDPEEDGEEAPPLAPSPEPSPEPSPTPSSPPTEPAPTEPAPTESGTPTEPPAPTESPTSEPPVLPLPGPSEGSTDGSSGGADAGDGNGDGTGDATSGGDGTGAGA